MKNQKGFSLIELLIVVVIIGIIAAIAIPNLLASRRAANEGSAISALRTIHGAEVTYSGTTGAGAYGDLGQLAAAGLVDSVMATANGAGNFKSGYMYNVTPGINPTLGSGYIFSCVASPAVHTSTSAFSATGSRLFLIAEVGVIYATGSTTAPTINATTRLVTGGSPLNN